MPMPIDLYGNTPIHLTMLDQRDSVGAVDRKDMLGAIESSPKQLADGLRRGLNSGFPKFIPSEIIVCGVGGSAIGGDLLREWLEAISSVRCEVCRSYSLPAHVGKDALVIVASYSGNTEETLSMFDDAKRRRTKIVAVSSGGRLSKAAVAEGIPLAKIPTGVQPRASLGYMFGAMVGALERSGIVDSDKQVVETVRILNQVVAACRPSVRTADNEAKMLAHKLYPSMPLIVGYGLSGPVAKRWANQFHENAKILAFAATLPEFDHNEIVGWMLDPRTRMFSSIFLQHDARGPMKRRIEATKAMVARVAPACDVHSHGASPMAKMMSLVLIGDYVSAYLGILRRVDPASNEPIDELKSTLSKK
jgi:glucose/mannose-6-phosphate isomerase